MKIGPILRNKRAYDQPQCRGEYEDIYNGTKAKVLQPVSTGIVPPATNSDDPRKGESNDKMMSIEPPKPIAG